MRKTRLVVLPVRAWNNIGLLIVSLACLTLGHVSRDREGRHGTLAGPELMHTAPHEVDACPNQICPTYFTSTTSSSPRSKLGHVRSNVQDATARSYDSFRNRDRSDITRLIDDENREHRLEKKRERHQPAKTHFSDEGQERRLRSLERRDTRLRMQNSDKADIRRIRLARENRVRQDPSIERYDVRFRTLSREPSRRNIHNLKNVVQREYGRQQRSLGSKSDQHRTRILEDQTNTKGQRDSLSERRLTANSETHKTINRRNINLIKRSKTSDVFDGDTNASLFNSQMERRTGTPMNEQHRTSGSRNSRIKEIAKEGKLQDSRSERVLRSEQARIRATENQLASRTDRHLFSVKRIRSSENLKIPVTDVKREVRISRNERRSISEEPRLRMYDNHHISRLERNSPSAERVRAIQNQRMSVGDQEYRLQNIQKGRRLISEERQVRSHENQLKRRLPDIDRLRMIEHQQVRIVKDGGRIRNARNEQRMVREYRRVRSDQNRLYSQAERLPSENRLRMLEKRQIRTVEVENRVRNLKNERRSLNLSENRQVRSNENRLDLRVERQPSADRLRMLNNRQIRTSEKERRARSPQYDLKSVGKEERARAAKARFDSAKQALSPKVEKVLILKDRPSLGSKGDGQVRISKNERTSINDERRFRISDNRHVSRVVKSLPSVERVRVLNNHQILASIGQHQLHNVENDRKLNSEERRVQITEIRVKSPLQRTFLSLKRDSTIESPVAKKQSRRLNSRNEQRSLDNKRALRTAINRLNLEAKQKIATIEPVRTAEKQLRMTQDEYRVHNLQKDRRLFREERARAAKSRKDFQAERRIRNTHIDRSLIANRQSGFIAFEIQSQIKKASLLDRGSQRNSQQIPVNIRKQNMEAREFSRIPHNIGELKLQKNRQSFTRDALRSANLSNENQRSLMSRNGNKRNLKRDNRRTHEPLDTLQVNGKKMYELRQNIQVQKRIETATLNKKQLKNLGIPMINTQYLKSVISDNNLNATYSLLQQTIIIVICAAYGASIFNKKAGPFRNFAQFTTRIFVW